VRLVDLDAGHRLRSNTHTAFSHALFATAIVAHSTHHNGGWIGSVPELTHHAAIAAGPPGGTGRLHVRIMSARKLK